MVASNWWDSVEGIRGVLRGEIGGPSADDLPAVLALAWLAFGRLFLGGELPRVRVEVVAVAPRLLSKWEPGGKVGRLMLGGRVAAVFPWAVARTLHEAVRAHCVTALGAQEEGYHGHGPEFCAVANRVGALLGVAKVAPKGRGGARAGDWPLAKPPKQPPPEVARAVLLPIERRELESLRVEVVELRNRPASDGARVELVAVCKAVGGAVRRAAAARDAVLAESTHGGKAAQGRALARELESLRDALASAVSDPGARAALGVK